jgi:putative oxidoreductase
MESLHDVMALVGRILLALIFVLSGLSKVMHMSGTAGYMVHAGISTQLVYPALYLSIAVELGCGLLIVAGLQARWAALIIFLWLIPVTLIFHVAGYLHAVQPQVAMTQQTMAMKNISMMGGLLLLAGLGPGRLSIDGRARTAGMGSAQRAA